MNIISTQIVKTSSRLIAFRKEILQFADELGEDDIHLGDTMLLREEFSRYLQMNIRHSKGKSLPDGWVPHTLYWYMDSFDIVIGSAALRHRLTPSLEELGGHISYVVRPSCRNKGHATKLLAFILTEARKLSLDRVLLTTDVDNRASRRVIEKNGGRLEGIAFSRIVEKFKARYWITI